MSAEYIQSFLKKKMKEHKLSRNDLVVKTGIAYPIIHDLIHANKKHPSLRTVLTLANSFQSSVDEILGRKKFVNKKVSVSVVAVEEVISTLRDNIKGRIERDSIHPVKLAREIDVGGSSIKEFIQEPPKKQSLGIAILAKLADHWKISIDEMMGRVPPSKNINVKKTQDQTSVSKENKDPLDNIKNKLSNIVQQESISEKPKKPQSFVDRIKQERKDKAADIQR